MLGGSGRLACLAHLLPPLVVEPRPPNRLHRGLAVVSEALVPNRRLGGGRALKAGLIAPSAQQVRREGGRQGLQPCPAPSRPSRLPCCVAAKGGSVRTAHTAPPAVAHIASPRLCSFTTGTWAGPAHHQVSIPSPPTLARVRNADACVPASVPQPDCARRGGLRECGHLAPSGPPEHQVREGGVS